MPTTNSESVPKTESVVVWGWLSLFLISIALFAVNIPYYDEWFHLRWALRILDGGHTGAGPFEWVNGSRLVLFRLFLLGNLRYLGGYSPLPLMAVSALCCTLSALAVTRLLQRTLPPSGLRILAILAVTVLTASLAQHEVLLWGIGFSLALPSTIAVLGALTIPRVSPHLRLRLALGLSLLGLLSFVVGVALFAVLGFAAWRAGATRRATLVFAAVALAVLVAWHADFNTASSVVAAEAAQLSGVARLWRIPAHFLAALGSGATASVLWPLARKGGAMLTPLIDLTAVLAGVAILMVFALELVRSRKRTTKDSLTQTAWTLFLFGLCAAALIALGRHDQGVSQALSSRYVTLTVLAPVGVALILARDGRRWALALLAAAALANAAAGVVVAYAWREARIEGSASLPFVGELPELPGFEALTPNFPEGAAASLMRRRMIAPALAPAGVGQAIALAPPAAMPAACALTPPGALTPTYRKPTTAIASFEVNPSRPGALVVVGRSAGAIRGLFAETIESPGRRTVRTTLKGAPAGGIDLEAWLVTDASTDFLVRVGACRTTIP